MTLLDQIKAQKALMEEKGAIGLRLEVSLAVLDEFLEWSQDENGDDHSSRPARIAGLPYDLKSNMEGFAILATWPEPDA